MTEQEKRILKQVEDAINNGSKFPFYCCQLDRGAFLYRITDYMPEDNGLRKKDIQYPPAEKVTLGRCNFAKQPIFYCADNADATLVERVALWTGNELIGNKIYYISRWKVAKTIHLVDFYFKTIESNTHPDVSEEILKRHHEVKDKFPKDFKDIEQKLANCGDSFAIEGKEAYDFTAKLSNLIYNQHIVGCKRLGLSYIGTKTCSFSGKKLNHYSNFAFHCDVIDKNYLEFDSVIECSVALEPNKQKSISIIRTAKCISDDDVIPLIDDDLENDRFAKEYFPDMTFKQKTNF